MSAPRYDAIVIGAGMSGLAAAIRLAQFDKRVVLLERHSLWGGLNSFYKRQGRRLDTGLHALTNYVPRGTPHAPLTKILRQLRLAWDDLALAPQSHSEIVFRSARLSFSNDPALLEGEIARTFPAERAGYARLVAELRAADPFDPLAPFASTRARLAEYLREPLLREMLLLPVCWYGSALEDDVDWNDFVILFRALFLEGFAMPEGGIQRLLALLVARCRELGVELRMNTGVRRLVHEHGRVRGVELDDGTPLEGEQVFSCAGWVETCALAGAPRPESERGWVTLFESLAVTRRPHRERGHTATISFVSEDDRLHWRRPEELVGGANAVLCCSDNYQRAEAPTEGLLRATLLANHDRWCALDEPGYRAAKERCTALVDELCARHVPDPRAELVWRDAFTPRTIRHYTSHAGGAVYGSPVKHRDGTSGIDGLILIGSDQGLMGVTGALLSGITMANQHALYARSP